jgi:hypothetical protein
MVNRWIEFCKEYSKTHGISYGCAVFDPRCKAEYLKEHPKIPKISKAQNRVNKIKISGSKSLTANQKLIKQRLEERIQKNKMERNVSKIPLPPKNYSSTKSYSSTNIPRYVKK